MPRGQASFFAHFGCWGPACSPRRGRSHGLVEEASAWKESTGQGRRGKADEDLRMEMQHLDTRTVIPAQGRLRGLMYLNGEVWTYAGIKPLLPGPAIDSAHCC